jgi:hypothetical protein
MATIDEIFENMPAEASVNYEELIIDAESREILVPDAEAIFGVESDTHSERKYFRCPRYVGDGLDLASCFLRMNFRNANGDVDSYLVTDVSIDGEYITFSWELSRKVTAYKGAVQFNVCAIMGAGLPEWNTTLAEGLVLEGLEPDSSTVETETADVVAQLLATVEAQTAAVEAVGAAQRAEVQRVGENTIEEAKAAVEAKGEAVKASIPEDYSTLSATVDKLTRDRAAAIVCEAAGETIQVTDSSADPLVGLRSFGKSTQDGTPTPDAPVEIVSAKAPTVTVCGKNLLKTDGYIADGYSNTVNGITINVESGVAHVYGTNASASDYAVILRVSFTNDDVIVLPAGEYVTANGLTVSFNSLGQGTSWKNKSGAFTLDEPHKLIAFYIAANPGATIDQYIPLMFCAGSKTPTEYEHYRGGALTLSTPTALPGIPVTSGGNYTDANGQQWIADEIDLARGVYVQRVEMFNITGAESWQEHASGRLYAIMKNADTYAQSGMLSTHVTYSRSSASGYYGSVGNRGVYLNKNDKYQTVEELVTFLKENNVSIIALLLKPIETPLSTEEIEAFKTLLANKPITTVLNDAGAWMTLEYAADPKTYIDNKIAALFAANN